MALCKSAAHHVNALITAQNHGTILVMVAWFLACLLALCTALRLIYRCQSHYTRHLAIADDVVLVAASLCGLGTTIVISIAGDSGLGKRGCLLITADVDDIQIKVFISTILFVLALSISKCSMLMFLHHVADSTLQRAGIMVVGVVVLIWTLAVMTGIVFECEMPRPWEIWTGKCIPMVPFWITATVVDIVIDVTLIILSAHLVWRLRLDYRQKTIATSIFSLRILLVTSSALRLAYLNQAFSPSSDPTFNYIPYAIISQSQSTISVILSCALILRPLTNLLHATPSRLKHHRHSKHWSGSTIGGKPYESYDSYHPSDPFASTTRIITHEPLHAIQGSMSTPISPAASRKSLNNASRKSWNEDIMLPDVPLPAKYPVRAPPRPPPPSRPPPPCERDRPDLSMFTKKTVLRECPPAVTRVGVGTGISGVRREKSLAERGLV